MTAFRETCICPDIWCPVHAVDIEGHKLIIDGPDELAFCPECLMDRMPAGGCKNDQTK
jgi:hypothetical protein